MGIHLENIENYNHCSNNNREYLSKNFFQPMYVFVEHMQKYRVKYVCIRLRLSHFSPQKYLSMYVLCN